MSSDPSVWPGREEDRPLIETQEVNFGEIHVFRHVIRDRKSKEVIAIIYGGEPMS
jgi:hypothetical protein